MFTVGISTSAAFVLPRGGSSHLLSGLVHPDFDSGISKVDPLITRVIIYLLSGMGHQAGPIFDTLFKKNSWLVDNSIDTKRLK